MLGETYVHYSNTGSMGNRYGAFGFNAGERILPEKVRRPKKSAEKNAGLIKSK